MTASRDLGVELQLDETSADLPAGRRQGRGYDCDSCGQSFEGEPGGAGLYIWTRGEEVRYEEPPLCEPCAMRVTVGALLSWEAEDEEEG
jgi:hypothetical protein